MQFQTNMFLFLWKVAIVSEDLIVIGSWFQTFGAATENICLANIELSTVYSVLGTKSFLEMDDLRVVEIS